MPLDPAGRQFLDDRVDVERAHLSSDAEELEANGPGRGVSKLGVAHPDDERAAQTMFGRAEWAVDHVLTRR